MSSRIFVTYKTVPKHISKILPCLHAQYKPGVFVAESMGVVEEVKKIELKLGAKLRAFKDGTVEYPFNMFVSIYRPARLDTVYAIIAHSDAMTTIARFGPGNSLCVTIVDDGPPSETKIYQIGESVTVELTSVDIAPNGLGFSCRGVILT